MLDKKMTVSAGKDFEILPADKYTVQISDIKLKKRNKWQSTEEEEVFEYTLTILDDKEIDEDGNTCKGRILWHTTSKAFGKKSNLRKLAIAALRRELSEDEVQAFDPESIVGEVVDVLVIQKPNKDDTRVFNNISEVMRATPKSLQLKKEVVSPTAPITKTTKAAVAPKNSDPAEDMIAELERENQGKPLPESNEAESEEELAAMEAELKAAELAKKIAAKKAELAKKKAAQA